MKIINRGSALNVINRASSLIGDVVDDGRRIVETLAYNIGKLTASGRGGVGFASPTLGLLKEGAEAPTSWSVAAATTGTDAHWNRSVAAGITPVPSSAGDSANLSDGTYVFEVTATFADASTEVCTLTITTLDETLTLSHRDVFAGPTIVAAHVTGNPRYLEFATGWEAEEKRVQVRAIRPASLLTIRPADISRRARFSELDMLGCDNVEFADFEIYTAGTTKPANCALFVGDFSSSKTGEVTITRPVVRGTQAAMDSAANDAARGAFDGLRINGPCEMLTINDADFQQVFSGFGQNTTSDSGGTVTVVINRPKIRYFYNNAFILGGDSATNKTTIDINDAKIASPNRAGVVGVNISTVHPDVGQISDSAVNHEISFNRLTFVQADGSGYCQTIFSDNGTARADRILNVNGLIDVGRAYYGIAIASSIGATVKNITCWKTESGTIKSTTVPPEPDANDSHVPGGPRFYCRDTGPNTGSNLLQNAIFYDDVLDASGVWTQTNVVTHSGTLTSAPVDTGFSVSNPKAAFDALDYTSMNIDQIATAIQGIVTPVLAGAYDPSGGNWPGALTNTGVWNPA